MSTLLLSLARENPWPGLALASLNLVVALSLVGLSLLLGVTIDSGVLTAPCGGADNSSDVDRFI